MREYCILKVENKTKYIILATSYVNPLDSLDEISEDLNKYSYIGMVLFDLLLCNGMNRNRYIELQFNGNKFEFDSVKIVNVNEIEDNVKELVRKKLLATPEMFQRSVLPDSQRFLFLKGRVR